MIKVEILAQLLREAERAHAEFEKHTGQKDPNWPKWYAEYVASRLEAYQE